MGANYSNYKSWEMPRTGGEKRVKLDLFTLFPREREGNRGEWGLSGMGHHNPPHVPWASAISLLTFFFLSRSYTHHSVYSGENKVAVF